MRKVSSRVASFSSHSWVCISTLGPTRGESVGILMYQSMSAILHLRKSTASGSLGIEQIQPSQDRSGRLCISSSCISCHGSVHVSSRTCHPSIQTSDSSCTLLNGGYLVFDSSQQVARHSFQCPIVRNPIRDVLGGKFSRVYHHIILPFHYSKTFWTDKGSLLQSVRQWGGWLEHLQWKSTISVGRNGQVDVLKMATKKCHICS